MLTRTMRIEEDLVISFSIPARNDCAGAPDDGEFRKSGQRDCDPQISQETLAEMIGTTRSRVSFFMNKFRKWGSSNTTGRWKFTAPVKRRFARSSCNQLQPEASVLDAPPVEEGASERQR
jgi:hypothetical protein